MQNATRARRLYRTMWTILEEICKSRGVSLNNLVQFHFQHQREDFNALVHTLLPAGLLHLPMIQTRYLDRVPRQRQTILAQCASIIRTVLSHFSGPGQTIDTQFIADLLAAPLMTETLRGDASLAFQIQRNVVAGFREIPLQSSARIAFRQATMKGIPPAQVARLLGISLNSACRPIPDARR